MLRCGVCSVGKDGRRGLGLEKMLYAVEGEVIDRQKCPVSARGLCSGLVWFAVWIYGVWVDLDLRWGIGTCSNEKKACSVSVSIDNAI